MNAPNPKSTDLTHIGIDARMVRSNSMHGIARYVMEILLEYRNIPGDFNFFIFCLPDSPLFQYEWPANFKFKPVTFRWLGLLEHVTLPFLLHRYKIKIFHSPSYVSPFFIPCKLIMTLHDVNHIALPQNYTWLHKFYFKTVVKRAVKNAEYILTVSEFSKKEIAKHLSISEKKIFVTYNGISSDFNDLSQGKNSLKPNHLSYIRNTYDLPDHYIFCIANNKPHKNLLRFVEAYCQSKVNIPLVIAASVNKNIIQLADSYKKKHLIYYLPYIAEKDLPYIYSMAELFCYPSSYEGFGLPPLESLACSTPVMVSSVSSLPEVVGDCGFYSNPFSIQNMADVLEKALHSQLERELKLKKAPQQISKFSWATTSQNTIAVYRKCQN